MRDSMIIYRSFYEAIAELPPENIAEIWGAVFELGLNGQEVQLKGINKTVFTLIKPQIEANNKKFINGSKPKQKTSKPKVKVKQTESKLQGNVNVNVNVNEKKRDGFLKLLEPYKKIYSAKMLNKFFEYWTAQAINETALRFENERFFDISKRLASWKKREKPSDYDDHNTDPLVNHLLKKGVKL